MKPQVIGFVLMAWIPLAHGGFVGDLPGLQSVVVHERTGGSAPQAISFTPLANALLNRILNLSASADFTGTTSERYDIFYSTAVGVPDTQGAYLTIEGLYPDSGAGFNIAEVELRFAGGGSELASVVSAFTIGTGGSAASTASAIDGNLLTHTALGQSSDNANRMTLTVGFDSTIPEPGMLTVLAVGTAVLVVRRRLLDV